MIERRPKLEGGRSAEATCPRQLELRRVRAATGVAIAAA
jgi:hypothetical protein